MESGQATAAWESLVSTVSFNQLPREVVSQTVDYIIDHTGDVIAGCRSSVGQALIKLAKEEEGKPEATILGVGIKTSCTMAALVNAKMGNIYDNSEVFLSRLHIGTIPFCAALATAEKVHGSGRDVILATVLGYEICARCGLASPLLEVTPQREVRFPSVQGHSYNVFGAAVAAAKVLGLDRERIRDALSLAAYFAPLPLTGLWRRRAPRNVSKYAELGWITHAGVTAALLARNGYPGDEAILDADNFWLACGVSEFDYGALLEGLGKKWYIMESGIKPYPCCRGLHASIDMLTKIMRENTLRPDDIDSIKIKISPAFLNPEYIFGKVSRWDSVERKDYISSQFSITYNIACAAYGILPSGPEWHTPERLHDPRLIEFGKKVILEENPRATETAESLLAYKGPPGAIRRKFPIAIEVHAGKKTFIDSSDHARGESWVPGYRLSHQEIEEKFRVNVSGTLSPSQTEFALSRINEIERVKDIWEITSVLSP